ncbi:hypothetical protein N9N28_09040 [Rubripirellula amarantea]|nr:hypothetical protein [Rubripirellula amarantea]
MAMIAVKRVFQPTCTHDSASVSQRMVDLFARTIKATLVMAGCALIAANSLGCRSTKATAKAMDSRLVRLAEDGNTAYDEGDLNVAVKKYRQAIARAWSMDDPFESGTHAYNLAACLTSLSDNAVATDWLIESRAELCRANASTANTWLLEAKIAQSELRLSDADRMVDRAACAKPPCADDGQVCQCGRNDPCRESCVTKIPCVGSCFAENEAEESCRVAYQAQIHLARARIAAERYDIPLANEQLSCACELASQVCSEDMQAELQRVSALVHLAKGEYMQAAWHFDKEADHLRLAGTYREIPNTLELAAGAYEQAGLPRDAALRLTRVAKIWFGRGDTTRAWSFVQQASVQAEVAGCESINRRLALIAHEIQQAVLANGQPLSSLSPEVEPMDQLSDQPSEFDWLKNDSLNPFPDVVTATWIPPTK